MSRIKLIAFGVALLVALLLGYLPEHSTRTAADAENRALRARVEAAESRNRLAGLLGQALLIQDLVTRADYGQGQQASSSFFDAVRLEMQTSTQTESGNPLVAVLAHRDVVTAALAKADPAVIDALKSVTQRLRTALDYPVVGEPASPTLAPPAPRTP